MKIELNHFIKEIAAGDESVYVNHGHTPLIEKMKELFGFKRWHTPILRPDSDPCWTPFRWSSEPNAAVKNIRVMSFNHLYNMALKEITEKEEISFPNGWKVAELIDTLLQLRREYKAGFIQSGYDDPLNIPAYNAYQMIAKFMLNCIFTIVAQHGSGLSVSIGAHDIVFQARNKVVEAVRKISKTGVVLYVNTDEIIYFGDQVEIDGVHHEKYQKAIFFSPTRAAYGNDIRTSSMPFVRLDMSDWQPSSFFNKFNVEEQKERAEIRIGKRIAIFRQSLNEYINMTKEDIDRKNSIDEKCFDL